MRSARLPTWQTPCHDQSPAAHPQARSTPRCSRSCGGELGRRDARTPTPPGQNWKGYLRGAVARAPGPREWNMSHVGRDHASAPRPSLCRIATCWNGGTVNTSLTRRLERLEIRLLPVACEPTILIAEFVDSDRNV